MIWCVEDDASIRDIEVYALQSTGIEARGFEDGTSFWEALNGGEKPELAVIDVMLPSISGIDLLRRMKASSELCDIPVVMATAKDTEYDKITGLEVNLDEHTVTGDGEKIVLTYKEFELLKLFLSNPGTAFTRDKLMEEVWSTDYCGETRTVDMHIRTLRQKLGRFGEMIKTVRGVGYRLEADK